jgi:hypothetical protein
MVTDSEGRLKTAFTPSIRGGYHPLLKTFTLGKKHQEVFLAAAQGEADTDVAYRVVDFSHAHKVKETFSGVENFGVTTTAQYLDGRRFRVICHSGEHARKILDAATDDKDSLHVFDAEVQGAEKLFASSGYEFGSVDAGGWSAPCPPRKFLMRTERPY